MCRRKTPRSVCGFRAGAGVYVDDGEHVGVDHRRDPGLREHLLAEQVSCVVIESTSDYWKPFYYLLEDALPVMLVNAKAARNVPGRKTDVSDAAWLADLGAHGLIRASFVPPAPIRVLRDLTRARSTITRARTKEIQRLEKLLEDTGIKLSAVASNIVGSRVGRCWRR